MFNDKVDQKFDSVFDLLKELETLSVSENNKSPTTSNKSPNQFSSFNEDQFFRGSSITTDYFRNSSVSDVFFRNNSEQDYFHEKKRALTSKNIFVPTDFIITSTIGHGNYAKIIKAKHKITGEVYAVKVFEKKFMEKEKKFYQIYAENEILNICNHSNIIKIFGAYEDEDKTYLVLEHCSKGDLEEYIRSNLPIEEDIAKFFLAQIVNILEYFHENKIIHRDLKPENLVINNSYQLKIVDFSTATFKNKIMDEDSFTFVDEEKYLQLSNSNIEEAFHDEEYYNIYKKQNFVGTAEYMAPEVIQMKEIGTYTDLWSLGCIIFQIFMGHSPFTDKTQYLIFQNILNLKYKIDLNLVPEDAYDLIKKLLKLDPKERLGSGLTLDNNLDKLKNHKFFSNFNTKKYLNILESRIKNHKDIVNQNPFTSTGNSNKHISQSENFDATTEHNEKILKQGTLKKKSPWLYYDKRKLILFNTPRVDYLDPDSNLLKGSIPLSKKCKAELIDSTKFELQTPNRHFTFMCKPKYDITPWVIAINEAIQQYAKH